MKFPPKPIFGFTSRYPGLTNVLANDIEVTEAFEPNSGFTKPVGKQFKGIWDTGASGTVINSRIINELNLKPTGKVKILAVGDNGKVNEYITDTYSINIVLPNKVTIYGVVAAKGEIGGGDALIGMDVITLGDLAITNSNHKTVMSFMTPSVQEIDFVGEIDEHNRKIVHANRSEDERRRERNKRKAEKRKGKK